MPALDRILALEPRVDHIVIETSGLALPKPLVQAFQWPGVRSRVTVDGVVAVVDGPALAEGRVAPDMAALAAQRGADPSLDHDDPVEEVFGDQVACADLVVLSKGDLLDAGARWRRRGRGSRRHLGRAVKIVAVERGRIDPAVLLGLGLAVEDEIDGRRTLHDGMLDHEHDDFDSFVVELPAVARAGGAGGAGAGGGGGGGRAAGQGVRRGGGQADAAAGAGGGAAGGVIHYDRAWGPGERAGDAAGGDRAEGPRPGGGRGDPRGGPSGEMHILNVTTASLDDLVEPVDLGQAPARDGGGVLLRQRPRGAGRGVARTGMPELRLARAARPAASDVGRSLGREGGGAGAGGPGAAARRLRLVALRLRPAGGGGARARASRWRCCRASAGRTTRGWRRFRRCRREQAALLGYFREGGPENMRGAAGAAGGLPARRPAAARPLPRAGCVPGGRSWRRRPGRPVVPILFYRSMLLAGDVAPVEALAAALEAEGIAAVPVFVPSLRDAASLGVVEAASGGCGRRRS